MTHFDSIGTGVELEEADQELRALLQRETTYRHTAEEGGEHALEAIGKQAELLHRLHDAEVPTQLAREHRLTRAARSKIIRHNASIS